MNALLFAIAAAQNPSQAIRAELAQPFGYFRAPTDQIGFKRSPNATVVTYDGAFITPYGQLSFYAGSPGHIRPITQRVKTMLDGYLPVIQFKFDRDGLRYDFEAFATPLHLDPKDNLVTFIQCKVSNLGTQSHKGVFGLNFGEIDSALNQDKAYDWFMGQRKALKGALGAQRTNTWLSDRFMKPAEFVPQTDEHAFHDGELDLNLHVVFEGLPEVGDYGIPGLPQTLGSAAHYDFQVAPKATKVFRVKLPDVPIEVSREAEKIDLRRADYDDYRAKTIAFWQRELAATKRFQVDDTKVMNTFRSSLVNDLTATELNQDGQIYQRVNKIHYDYMWIRDSSFFVRTYDMLGLHALAKALLHDFLVWQGGNPVGFFKPGSPQPKGARLSVQDDYWGQVLWAFGEHIRMTHDRALLQEIYPLLGSHIDEFVAKCAKDPRGLWPVAGPYDNEAIDGHYTGHSFWALLGLNYAIRMAEEMNRPEDVRKWQQIHDSYEANFLKQLRQLTVKSEGYIPPGMDSVTAGNDWDNASGGLYPFEVLSNADPMAVKTLQMVRDYNYQEGIITYGGNAWVAKQNKLQGKTAPRGYLHHYETFYVTESNTVLGEQKKVVEDLYSILAHTGSTNSGFEFSIPAWSTRDPQDNFTPHGWFAARYLSQIRDALVREQGTDLHLASVLAPDWVKPGKQVVVKDAPTYFGSVSYRMQCRTHGATIGLDNHFTTAPSLMILHIPWFLHVDSVTIDGKPSAVIGGQLNLPLSARHVELKWQWIEHPNLSYKEAVRLFLDKYYRKPKGADYDFLFPR